MIAESLKKIVSREDISENEAYACMEEMISGEADDIQMAAFLTALNMKGESVEEITGFSRAMRDFSIKVSPDLDAPLVDTCGTGGDTLKTFNVSTISGIIASSAGVVIAKHGNRNITSKCGGADVLESLGVNINGDAQKVERCLEKAGIGFMFAPNFHPATKNVMPVRNKLGIRTVFNVIGPLSSPANVDIQLMGVFDPDYVEIIAKVLKNLGVKKAMVVHGYDAKGMPAMDEISTIGKTKVAILINKKVVIKEIYPEDFGIERASPNLIEAPENIKGNVQVALDVLRGINNKTRDQARLDICLINTSAILFLAGKVDNFKNGTKMAYKLVKSGCAYKKLQEFINISQ
ncbi:MAG: anthranilate phosphoribosyltransferase [Methanomicrobiales archaeon]